MGATPKVTGAVHAFTNAGSRAFRYLGTGKYAPRWQLRYGWVPFFNDLGGPIIPFDEVFAGEEAIISLPLNRYEQPPLSAIESVPNSFGIAGLNPFGDIGSMVLFEGLAYQLVFTFPYYAKPAMRANGMPPGVRFPFCKTEGPTVYSQGNVPREINLIFKAKSGYDPRTGASLLGDHNVRGMPPIS